MRLSRRAELGEGTAVAQLADDVAGLAAYIALHTAQIDEKRAFTAVAARWGKDFPQDG